MKRIVLSLLILLLAASVVWFASPGKERPDFDQTHMVNKTASVVESVESSPEIVNTIGGGWNRFRGPNGSGVSTDETIPLIWNDTENLAWKTKLPGHGASSPVLTDESVFVTAYSGYGIDENDPGDIEQLKRHVVCVARSDGEIRWTKEFASTAVEDPFQGNGLPQHGYATNTPVTDGKHVFAFLGKSGVVALDVDGTLLWQVSVGTGSGNRRWGSAASLMLYGNLLIVNAAEESKTLFALDRETGDVVWESESEMLELCYSTPVVYQGGGKQDQLLLVVPNEMWGLNPDNGKTIWYADVPLSGNVSPLITISDGKAYAFGGYRDAGSVAVDLGSGGTDNKKPLLWESRATSYVSTPVLVDGRFHWINKKGIYHCSDAKDGKILFRSRVKGVTGPGNVAYASSVAINKMIYVQTRHNGVVVIEPREQLNVVARNEFTSDDSVFNGTPAVDAGQLFLRSNKYLYCVQKNESQE